MYFYIKGLRLFNLVCLVKGTDMSLMFHDDCLNWLDQQPEASFEAIVTDPPYGLKEYSAEEQIKLRDGNRTGMWRIPPALGGSVRAPLPRFTVLSQQDLENLYKFFFAWSTKSLRVVVPVRPH